MDFKRGEKCNDENDLVKMTIQVSYPKSINLSVYPNHEQFKYLETPFIIRIAIVEMSNNILNNTNNTNIDNNTNR